MRIKLLPKKTLRIIVLIFILIVLVVKTPKLKEINFENRNETNNNIKLYKVTRVIDGDTIEIEGGKRVRYIGINTPETVDPRKKVECFGREASNKNKEFVEGQIVRFEKDISETDKYGRLLRYVYVDNQFINLELVKNGYAYSSTFPPDVKYQKVFLDAETTAREKNLGLWSSCK